MEEFEILQVDFITYDDNFHRDLEQPILNIKVHYCNEIMSYNYELNSENQWIFQGNTRILSDLNNNNLFYHFNVMSVKRRKGTVGEFKKKMDRLAPAILNHQKVRIKALLYK